MAQAYRRSIEGVQTGRIYPVGYCRAGRRRLHQAVVAGTLTADCLRPKTDVEKLSLIIPLLALIALLVWWFTPHYTEEDEAYYRAVFCIIDHDDSRQFLHDMQNIVEGKF